MFCTFQSTVVQKKPKFGWDLLREDGSHLAVAGNLVGHLLLVSPLIPFLCQSTFVPGVLVPGVLLNGRIVW